MIRRPSYKEFLNQTIQSSHKTSLPSQNIPSQERPPLSPYHTKRTTLPQNSNKDYAYKNSSLSQTLLKIPSNPSSMRQTQGYTRVTADRKQNIDSSFHYIPKANNAKSPIKSAKTSLWKPSWKQSSSYNDYEYKKQPQTACNGGDRLMHQEFMKTAPTLTHIRSKATISAPLEQYFAEKKDYSPNGRSKFQITDKISSKNQIKSKACISAAVLPMGQPNKSRSTTPVNVPSLKTQSLLTPIQFRKKPTHVLEKSKESFDFLQRSTSKSNIRSSFKIEGVRTQPVRQKMCLSDFLVGKKMGEGRFGSVFMVVHKSTGAIFALKKIPKSVLKQHMMIDQFSLQVKLQAAVAHPNLVSVYSLFDDKEHVYLLLQYLSGGSLYGQLKKRGKFTEEQAAQRTKALCKAVEALHLRGIAHRDIKPQNIMISQGICKLGDFGWATICDERRRTYCGTTDYVSPEIVEGKQYGPGVDMWCVGVLAYQLITGRPPFYHLSKQQTFRRIEEATPTFPNSMSKEAIDFISGLLRKVPEERMSACEALNHPFIVKNQDKD